MQSHTAPPKPRTPTTTPRSLRTNATWSLIARVTESGFRWLMLLVLARLGTPAFVGLYSLGLALADPLLTPARLNLRTLVATDSTRTFQAGSYYLLLTLSTTLALAALSITLLYRQDAPATSLALFSVAALAALESFADLGYGFFQALHRTDISTRLQIARHAAITSVLAGTLTCGADFTSALAAATMTALTMLLIFDTRYLRRHIPRSEHHTSVTASLKDAFRPCGHLFRIAFPWGIVVLLSTAASSFPRIVLDSHYGETELGRLAAAGVFMMLPALLVIGLSQGVVARLAEHYSSRDLRSFRELLTKLQLLAFTAGTAGFLTTILAGNFILTSTFGPPFSLPHADLYIFAAVGMTNCFVSVFGVSLNAMRQHTPSLLIHLVALSVTLTFGHWAITSLGINGTAWTLLLHSATVSAGGFIVTHICFTNVTSPTR